MSEAGRGVWHERHSDRRRKFNVLHWLQDQSPGRGVVGRGTPESAALGRAPPHPRHALRLAKLVPLQAAHTQSSPAFPAAFSVFAAEQPKHVDRLAKFIWEHAVQIQSPRRRPFAA